MSEYQYHEWQTVDRVLTPAEQTAVNNLSNHIDVSSSRAVVTYHWSNFRHDPRQVLLKYFEDYFNSSGEKTLRAYTVSLNLARFDRQDWLTRDETMDSIADALDRIRKVKLITPRMAARLLPVDPLALQAGLLGSNPDGPFKL